MGKAEEAKITKQEKITSDTGWATNLLEALRSSLVELSRQLRQHARLKHGRNSAQARCDKILTLLCGRAYGSVPKAADAHEIFLKILFKKRTRSSLIAQTSQWVKMMRAEKTE
jgi:hypothetical protein